MLGEQRGKRPGADADVQDAAAGPQRRQLRRGLQRRSVAGKRPIGLLEIRIVACGPVIEERSRLVLVPRTLPAQREPSFVATME